MIIWLASYPKSGNTLVRALLSSYFFSNDGIFNFEIIKNIKQFPHIGLFENLGIDIKNEKVVIENYINAQASISKKDSVIRNQIGFEILGSFTEKKDDKKIIETSLKTISKIKYKSGNLVIGNIEIFRLLLDKLD